MSDGKEICSDNISSDIDPWQPWFLFIPYVHTKFAKKYPIYILHVFYDLFLHVLPIV